MIEEKNERLSAHEVATFLRRHPKFLGQFPDLALSLVVPKDEGQAASLASYQLDVLRDKNRELTRRLEQSLVLNRLVMDNSLDVICATRTRRGHRS